jgi:protein-tyrosine phosphatase
MIDLHNHLLPGVDDGSRSVAQSVRVLRSFLAQGITDVVCTPHLLASRAEHGWPENYEAAWQELMPEVPDGMTLHRGAEVMLDRPVGPQIAERKVTLNGSRYLLVEFQRMVPAEIAARALADVTRHGLIPLLAHAERYSSSSVASVRVWREVGAVIQVDATTMTLPRSRGERARDLVREGLADVLAADNHGDDRSVATALDWLTEHDAGEQAILLLDTNPRAILEDKATYEVDPLPIRRSVWNSVRRILGTE